MVNWEIQSITVNLVSIASVIITNSGYKGHVDVEFYLWREIKLDCCKIELLTVTVFAWWEINSFNKTVLGFWVGFVWLVVFFLFVFYILPLVTVVCFIE